MIKRHAIATYLLGHSLRICALIYIYYLSWPGLDCMAINRCGYYIIFFMLCKLIIKLFGNASSLCSRDPLPVLILKQLTVYLKLKPWNSQIPIAKINVLMTKQ